MKKTLLMAAVLALPLSLMAAEGGSPRGEREEAAKAPAAAASGAPSHQHHAKDPVLVAQHRDQQAQEVRQAKDRGSRMGACRKEAQDQGLGDAEMKMAISACLKRAP